MSQFIFRLVYFNLMRDQYLLLIPTKNLQKRSLKRKVSFSFNGNSDGKNEFYVYKRKKKCIEIKIA